MSEQESKRLCEMLQTATAGTLPADAVLDDETAELREGWLALGEALDGCPEEVDTDRILAFAHPIRRRRTGWLVLVAAGALAASLTGAVALFRPEPTRPAAAPAEPAPLRVAAHPQPSKPVAQPDEASSGADFEWDDSLDTEIALVREMVVETRQSWAFDRTNYTVLQQRIQELEQHLGDEAL